MGWVIFPVMDELSDTGGGLRVGMERWIRKGRKERAIVMSTTVHSSVATGQLFAAKLLLTHLSPHANSENHQHFFPLLFSQLLFPSHLFDTVNGSCLFMSFCSTFCADAWTAAVTSLGAVNVKFPKLSAL